jgi:hypothetical protein
MTKVRYRTVAILPFLARHDLQVWQRSMVLARAFYELTE